MKNIRLLPFLFFFLFLSYQAKSRCDTTHFIKVHFLYGSKPVRKYKSTEKRYFGGIHGGHVSIQVDSTEYGFSPDERRFHIFTHHHNRHSKFNAKPINGPVYPKDCKLTTFIIPLSEEQYRQLNTIDSGYCSKSPYDYAFFGMRCAASAQNVLGQIGVVKKWKRIKTIYFTFYPKKLRKRMFKLAAEKNYTIEKQEGRSTRKWERD